MCKKNTDKLRVNWLFIYVCAETREAIIHFGILNELRISVYFTFPCCSVSSVTIPKTRLFVEMLSFEVNDLSVFSRLYAYILMCMV